MADTGTSSGSSTSSSKGGTFGFLTRKVGPAPIWVYAVIGFGVYYWYTHYGPGAQSSQAQQQAPGTATILTVAGAGGQDEEPERRDRNKKPPITVPPNKGGGGGWKEITVPSSWNGWSLDKISSYLHWTPETLSDVEEANAQGGQEITGSTTFHTGDVILRPVGAAKGGAQQGDTGTGATGGSGNQANAAARGKQAGRRAVLNAAPGKGSPDGASSGLLGAYTPYSGQNTWKSATGWEAAAINYLIGEGVAPDQASSSIWAYMHSEPMSALMQSHVTLAVDGIGPPPNIPKPTVTQKTVSAAQASRQPVTVGASSGS